MFLFTKSAFLNVALSNTHAYNHINSLYNKNDQRVSLNSLLHQNINDDVKQKERERQTKKNVERNENEENRQRIFFLIFTLSLSH